MVARASSLLLIEITNVEEGEADMLQCNGRWTVLVPKSGKPVPLKVRGNRCNYASMSISISYDASITSV